MGHWVKEILRLFRGIATRLGRGQYGEGWGGEGWTVCAACAGLSIQCAWGEGRILARTRRCASPLPAILVAVALELVPSPVAASFRRLRLAPGLGPAHDRRDPPWSLRHRRPRLSARACCCRQGRRWCQPCGRRCPARLARALAVAVTSVSSVPATSATIRHACHRVWWAASRCRPPACRCLLLQAPSPRWRPVPQLRYCCLLH